MTASNPFADPPAAGPASDPPSFARFWLGTALGLVATLGCVWALPFSPYIAWQQAEGTQMFHARWIYERLNFDPHPIDVALVGSSRFEAGLSAPVLAAELSRSLRRPVHVANLSLVMPGRDFSDRIVEELLAKHPEVRLVVLSNDGDVVNSHPMFRETASFAQLLDAPLVINTKYATNLLAAPYRNLANFAKARFPDWFGLTTRFRPERYAGTDLDRSRGYQLPDGEAINGDIVMPPAELALSSRSAIARQRAGLAWLRHVPDRWRLAIDRRYVASIAARARAARVRLAFVALPVFGPDQSPGSDAFYRRFGPAFSLAGLATQPAYFQNGVHLNRQGALAASVLAARALRQQTAQALGNEPVSPADQAHPDHQQGGDHGS